MSGVPESLTTTEQGTLARLRDKDEAFKTWHAGRVEALNIMLRGRGNVGQFVIDNLGTIHRIIQTGK